MSSSFRCAALAGLLALATSTGAGAQTIASPGGPSAALPAASQPASAPADKGKRTARAKTPPGKPPTGTAACSQGTKAQRQRCLHDMYGPGAPRI